MTAMSALSSNRAEEMEVDNTDDMMKVDWKNGEITWKIDKLDFPKLCVMHAINSVQIEIKPKRMWNIYNFSFVHNHITT